MIQAFVDNPVDESSPCISRVERQHIMLKLRIVASILGATSLVLLIMGSTHLTIAMAVICATVAGISATDIVLRLPSYITGGEKVFSKVMLVFFSFVLVVLATDILLNDMRVCDTPLSAPLDSVQNLRGISSSMSVLNFFAILAATIAPWPPKCNDSDDED